MKTKVGLVVVALALVAASKKEKPLTGPEGTGGTHTQGVLMCGARLDHFYGDQSSQRPTGSCAFEKIGGFPVNDLWFNSEDRPDKFHAINCRVPDGKALFELCDLAPDAGGICGDGQTLVFLLQGSVDFPAHLNWDSKRATAACAIPTDDDAGAFQNGAVGKCLSDSWFAIGPENDSELAKKTFEACLRMLRADYSGDSETATRPGVRIEGGDRKREDRGYTKCQSLQGACFESTWNENGAACLSKARDDVLSAFEEQTKQLRRQLEQIKEKTIQDELKSKIERRVSWIEVVKENKKKTSGPCVLWQKGKKAESGLIYSRSRRGLDTADCSVDDYDVPKCKPGSPPLQWDPPPAGVP